MPADRMEMCVIDFYRFVRHPLRHLSDHEIFNRPFDGQVFSDNVQ